MTEIKHLPSKLTVSNHSLWGDTPTLSHVKMADVTLNSNGIDAEHLSNELSKRWNSFIEMLEALEVVEQTGLTHGTSKIIRKAIKKAKGQ